jgi:hypothetical protein
MDAPLLIELFTEELPPRALARLGEAFAATIVDGLRAQGLAPQAGAVDVFATPRRLAVRRPGHQEGQPPGRIRIGRRMGEGAVESDHVLEIGQPGDFGPQRGLGQGAFEQHPARVTGPGRVALGHEDLDLRRQPGLGRRRGRKHVARDVPIFTHAQT